MTPTEFGRRNLPKKTLADMGVSKNHGKTPQIILILIGFSMIFTIHFGGKPPIFGNIHIEGWSNMYHICPRLMTNSQAPTRRLARPQKETHLPNLMFQVLSEQ